MDLAMTKMSSKGQIVIPSEMRKDIELGEKLIVMKKNDSIIIKKVGSLEKKFKEDIEFAIKTEKAWQDFEKGNFRSMSSEEFLKELKKW